MTNNEQDSKQPRVFISYAQCSEAHSARVLAQALRGHGIDTELDQYHMVQRSIATAPCTGRCGRLVGTDHPLICYRRIRL